VYSECGLSYNINGESDECLGVPVSETLSLRIPKNQGEKALILLRSMGILNREYKVKREQEYLYLPLTREPSSAELGELKCALSEFEVCPHKFLELAERPLKLFDLLENKLPPHILASLPSAIDVIGDIAVVEIPRELETYELTIGEAIMKANKKLKTVLEKSGAVGGVYRLRAFRVIGGQPKTEAVHREYGCVFHVDLAKAYFSPRLSYEHSRVASLVGSGETVLDMFAGVGGFSILIAKKHQDVVVYAVDLNPDAFGLLRKNVLVNRVEARVEPILCDARQIVNERLVGVADRVIMNLPEKAVEYVDVACKALKPEGGVIHYYRFSDAASPLENAKNQLTEAVKDANRHVERMSLVRIVRGIAPFAYQVAVDAEIM
jgi:tRNA (guanine37-N1)-methyltransferase